MMRPRRSRIMPLLARRTHRNAPVRLVSRTDVEVLVAHPHEEAVLGDARVGDEHLDRAPELLLGLGERGVDATRSR